jgi:8-oxo-dGTP pyrophosphatase MutT (NUDIX family)
VKQDELLQAVNDAHGGVIVDVKEPLSPAVFHSKLKASLSRWKQQGKKGVWIKLPIQLANLVESAVKEGFWYHHAEPDYLMLVYWIPITCSTIPSNATHRVSVGAILLNEKREMLVVQEKSGRFRGSGVWKIPTGVVDEGEDFYAAAIREVKEETGIDAEFLEVLAFRQAHKTFFGKSDLFFLCMMRPLSFDIQTQELEIEAAQWMPLEEYAAQPMAQEHEPFKYVTDMCLAKLNCGYTGFSKRPLSSMFHEQICCVYLNPKDLDQAS